MLFLIYFIVYLLCVTAFFPTNVVDRRIENVSGEMFNKYINIPSNLFLWLVVTPKTNCFFFFISLRVFGLLQVFAELGNLHGTSNYVLYWIRGIRTGDPRGFNEGHSSKFCVGSRVRQTPEEGRKTYRLKHSENNNKDEDNSPKTLNDKNHQASSKKFRQQKCFLIRAF